VGLSTPCWACCATKAPLTSAAPRTTSSAPSATASTPATRPRQASRSSCWASSRWQNGRWRRWGRRLAGGGIRGRRRPGDGSRSIRGGKGGRAGAHLHARQGPAQCVRASRVVMVDRRRKAVIDEAGVHERWGVAPESIADYLALVGDTSDGYPGLPAGREVRGRGSRSLGAARVDPQERRGLGRRRAVRSSAERHAGEPNGTTPSSTATWPGCAWTFPSPDLAEELRWRGARRLAWAALCEELGADALADRPHLWQD